MAIIKTILLSVLPIIELRGAIPVGVAMGLKLSHAFWLAYFGSLLPVPFLLLLTRPIFKFLARSRTGAKIVEAMSLRSIAHSTRVKKYGFWGLIIFVAIPLPGTGVWSGCLASVLLDIRFKEAFPAIAIGNMIAGIAITSITYGGRFIIDGIL